MFNGYSLQVIRFYIYFFRVTSDTVVINERQQTNQTVIIDDAVTEGLHKKDQLFETDKLNNTFDFYETTIRSTNRGQADTTIDTVIPGLKTDVVTSGHLALLNPIPPVNIQPVISNTPVVYNESQIIITKLLPHHTKPTTTTTIFKNGIATVNTVTSPADHLIYNLITSPDPQIVIRRPPSLDFTTLKTITTSNLYTTINTLNDSMTIKSVNITNNLSEGVNTSDSVYTRLKKSTTIHPRRVFVLNMRQDMFKTKYVLFFSF